MSKRCFWLFFVINSFGTDAKGNCSDPDLSKVATSIQLTLCDGTRQFGRLAFCTKDLEQDCINAGQFRSFNPSNLAATDVSFGTTVAGVTGTKRVTKQCRNAGDISHFDTSTPTAELVEINFNHVSDTVNFPNNNDVLSGTVGFRLVLAAGATLPAPFNTSSSYYVVNQVGTNAQLASTPGGTAITFGSNGTGIRFMDQAGDGLVSWWETITDMNYNLSTSPTSSPWGSEYICDSSNFENVSATYRPSGVVHPNATVAFTEVWRDNLTGLLFTNILYDGSGTTTFATAWRLCAGLPSENSSPWRLPTQKELLQLQIDGVTKLIVNGGPMSSGSFFSYSSFASIGSSENYIGYYLGWSANTTRHVICVQ